MKERKFKWCKKEPQRNSKQTQAEVQDQGAAVSSWMKVEEDPERATFASEGAG